MKVKFPSFPVNSNSTSSTASSEEKKGTGVPEIQNADPTKSKMEAMRKFIIVRGCISLAKTAQDDTTQVSCPNCKLEGPILQKLKFR